MRIVILLMLVLIGTEVTAAEGTVLNPSGILNASAEAFIAQARAAQAPIEAAAFRLFWILTGIVIVLNGIKLIFAQADLQALMAALVRLCLIIGIFEFLIRNGAQIGADIIDSLTALSGEQTGPSELVDLAFNLSSRLYENIETSVFSIDVSIVLLLTVLIFNLAMFMIAVNFACAYVSAYILCMSGILVLGFGAWSVTRDLAVGYLRTVGACALELMAMILVCNAGSAVLNEILGMMERAENGVSLSDLGVMLFTVLFIYALTRSVPALVGSLMQGGGRGSTPASGVAAAGLTAYHAGLSAVRTAGSLR